MRNPAELSARQKELKRLFVMPKYFAPHKIEIPEKQGIHDLFV